MYVILRKMFRDIKLLKPVSHYATIVQVIGVESMKKAIIGFMFTIVFILSGCTDTNAEQKELSNISIEGVTDQYVDRNDVVNLMDGVTVIGDDGIDYSDYVILSSYTCGFYNDTYLHTEVSKKCDIIYTVVVGNFFSREHATVYIR